MFGRRVFGIELPVDGLAELVRRRVQSCLPVEDGILNGGRWIAVVDHEAAVVLGAALHDRVELSIRWNDAFQIRFLFAWMLSAQQMMYENCVRRSGPRSMQY